MTPPCGGSADACQAFVSGNQDEWVESETLCGRSRCQHMQDDVVAIARAGYRAYVDKDRAAIEALIADDFRFTSPLDNHIDRATYFARCWPNSATIAKFDFIRLVADGERVFITYECQVESGKRFRNTEVLTIRAGKIVEAEVYFGWTVPHAAAEAGFVDPT
jgi:ketosteroid isomerase-like protein